jgi:hypothetical protein
MFHVIWLDNGVSLSCRNILENGNNSKETLWPDIIIDAKKW